MLHTKLFSKTFRFVFLRCQCHMLMLDAFVLSSLPLCMNLLSSPVLEESRLSNFSFLPALRLSNRSERRKKKLPLSKVVPRKHFDTVAFYFSFPFFSFTKKSLANFSFPRAWVVYCCFAFSARGKMMLEATFIVVISTSAHKRVSRKCKTNCSQFNKF